MPNAVETPTISLLQDYILLNGKYGKRRIYGLYKTMGDVDLLQGGKWQGWRDSNPQPSVLETAVLPIRTTPLARCALYGWH
jgi:hypothetical protein